MGLKNNPHDQGKFHLLVLFGIPVLLVLIFVVQKTWLVIAYLVLFLLVIRKLFRRK